MVSHCVYYYIVIVAVFAVQFPSSLAEDVDFRAFDFGDENTEFFSSYEKAFNELDYFPTDFNLGSLDLISATPQFAKAESYINPDDVNVARTKRKTASNEEDSTDSEEDEDADDRNVDGAEGYVDRYERFVSRHFRDRDEQRKKTDGDSEKGAAAQYEYRFDFSPSDDYERIKQESEAQSRRLAKNPKNCESYEKDGMVCHVCKDPGTETTSESCAYATVPHHNKFSYVKEKHFNSKDQPEEDRNVDDDDDDGEEDDENEDHSEKRAESITLNPKKPKVTPTKKSVVHTKPGGGPQQQETNGGGYRYQPVDLRSNKKRPQVQSPPNAAQQPAYYDFYTHFLPTHGRSQKIMQTEPTTGSEDDVYVLSYRDDSEVAKVLADFESRDWSNCKKDSPRQWLNISQLGGVLACWVGLFVSSVAYRFRGHISAVLFCLSSRFGVTLLY